MSNEIPQYSDFELLFNDITYNISTAAVDFSALDDIILSVCRGNTYDNPIIILKKSTDSARFTVDDIAKSVSIKLLSSDLNSKTGNYYINLYLVKSSEYLTHLKKSFEIVSSVNYQ